MAKKYDKRVGTVAGATQRSFALEAPAGNSTRLIRVAKLLSGENRRLYRQGMCYKVRLSLDADDSHVNVFTIRNTWMFRKAYALAYKVWWDSMQEEREMGMQSGRWMDFRVNIQAGVAMPNDLGYFHHALSAGGTTSNNNPQVDEYQLSKLYTNAGTERGFAIGGATVSTEYGILYEYDRQNDTDAGDGAIGPATLPYYEVKADTQYQEAVDMVEDYDKPPYDADQFDYTEPLVRHAALRTTSAGSYRQDLTLDVPLGLIVVTNTMGNTPKLHMEVLPGDYKGVNAVSLRQTGA
jgi:hypothetical protein